MLKSLSLLRPICSIAHCSNYFNEFTFVHKNDSDPLNIMDATV